jgi:hypothetical protein
LLDDKAAAFHLAVPQDSSLGAEFHLVEADAAGVRAARRDHAPSSDWGRRSASLLRFPPDLDLGAGLILGDGRVVDATPFSLRLVYDAAWSCRPGTAFCEVLYAHRLRWPLVGRMFEMSIGQTNGDR